MSDTDPNTEAHRIASQAGPEDQPASPELEAAFEAGWDTGRKADRNAE